jgi:hypothetical protein
VAYREDVSDTPEKNEVTKLLIHVAGGPDMIRTRYLPRANLKCYVSIRPLRSLT